MSCVWQKLSCWSQFTDKTRKKSYLKILKDKKQCLNCSYFKLSCQVSWYKTVQIQETQQVQWWFYLFIYFYSLKAIQAPLLFFGMLKWEIVLYCQLMRLILDLVKQFWLEIGQMCSDLSSYSGCTEKKKARSPSPECKSKERIPTKILFWMLSTLSVQPLDPSASSSLENNHCILFKGLKSAGWSYFSAVWFWILMSQIASGWWESILLKNGSVGAAVAVAVSLCCFPVGRREKPS